FGAVSTDVSTALPVTIREGDLEPALLASAAIPGIFPLVEYGGRRLYDGGVVANVPMTQAVQMGAKSLVVLDCTFPGQLSESLDTMTDILLFTAIVRMRSQAAMEAPIIASEVPVVYLPGPAAQLISPLDFEHTAELMEQSYAAARRFLQQVEVDGPGLYGSPGS
ncbi:MAG: patatin-like phospholipase family protein, partial [Ilumatobacter fluminis]